MATFFACLPDTIRKEWFFPGLSAAQGIYLAFVASLCVAVLLFGAALRQVGCQS